MDHNLKEKRQHIRHKMLDVLHHVALITNYDPKSWINTYYESKIIGYSTIVLNMSEGGCFIKCNEKHVPPPGSLVYVVFDSIPGVNRFISFGKVIRTNWSNKHKNTGFGVKWLYTNQIDSDIRNSCIAYFRENTLQKIVRKLISDLYR